MATSPMMWGAGIEPVSSSVNVATTIFSRSGRSWLNASLVFPSRSRHPRKPSATKIWRLCRIVLSTCRDSWESWRALISLLRVLSSKRLRDQLLASQLKEASSVCYLCQRPSSTTASRQSLTSKLNLWTSIPRKASTPKSPQSCTLSNRLSLY